jgi:hypothetical protein
MAGMPASLPAGVRLSAHISLGVIVRVVLRSKTPALVRQEVWGLLLTHFAVLSQISTAAKRSP